MDVTSLQSLLQKPRPVLFKTDGLDAAGLAKIDDSIKSAKSTLALADHLQTMRDVRRTLSAVQDSLKNGTTLSGKNLINFSL